jgi:heat-inducible transcriptional repressor
MASDIIRAERKLTPRQRAILKVLVQEYIAMAVPVGSSIIQKLGDMDVSSATIRNELAELEELGYVTQPHTSAGRVPTVKGYRYYVEQLMEQAELPVPEQRTIRHQFHQIRLDLDQWMRLTAAVLAHTAQSASLVTPPHAISSRFRHLELISVNSALCLMILVLQDSSIHQELLVMANPVDQERLSQTSSKLNGLLSNRTTREIRASTNRELVGLRDWEAQVLERVLYLMEQVDRHSISEIYQDGLANVMRQPEFLDLERLRDVVEIIEQRSLLESILTKILNTNGVQIIIGGEGAYQEIDDVSLVLSPYGIKGEASGVLGVMGPTRMQYARAISTVRYVAHLMDSLIADVYGTLREES